MSSSRRRVGCLSALLLSASASAQSQPPPQPSQPPAVERRELPPLGRQRLAALLQRVQEARPVYLAAQEELRAHEAKLQSLQERHEKLTAEINALVDEFHATNNRVTANKPKIDQTLARNKALMQRFGTGPIPEEFKQEMTENLRFLQAMQADIDRVQAINARLQPMAMELQQGAVAIADQQVTEFRSRLRYVKALLALKGVGAKGLGENRP
jgi:chromosome segregation ATPase